MLKLSNGSMKEAYLSITDVAGRVFYSGYVNLSEALNLNDLGMNSRLERGIYLVHIVSGSLSDTKRIILY